MTYLILDYFVNLPSYSKFKMRQNWPFCRLSYAASRLLAYLILVKKILAFHKHMNIIPNAGGGLWWFAVVWSFFNGTRSYRRIIVPNSGGDLRWCVVVCGGLRWFVVVCGDLRWFVF